MEAFTQSGTKYKVVWHGVPAIGRNFRPPDFLYIGMHLFHWALTNGLSANSANMRSKAVLRLEELVRISRYILIQ